MVSLTNKSAPVAGDDWLRSLSDQRSSLDVAVLKKALNRMQSVELTDDKQLHRAIAVANILSELGLDHEALAAAMLYEFVRVSALSLAEVRTEFGAVIANLLDAVMKMDAIRLFHDKARGENADAESLRKMLLAMVEDVRAVFIKLADRVYTMRTLVNLPDAERQRIAHETLDVFAPLANRLGIGQFKWELEDLALRYLNPELYKKIAQFLNERRIDREQYIERFMAQLQSELAKVGIAAQVTGRPKHIYSIYRKMLRKNIDYHQIYDVRAVRILVDNLPDCYAALGIVHSTWQYIPGEFDDYIATPKANNYQSLHTAIIGPDNKNVEVQIRTHDMHNHSELGVAAHWRYKEAAKPDANLEKRLSWLRNLLAWKDEIGDENEFVESLKADAFEDRVYVFTPKGRVIDLPHGATPLDFAYHIHTDVGHRCRGAKVNGRMVPLIYELKTGEQVEILLAKTGGPSLDWLNPNLGYLRSPRARAKAQHWFKQQNLDSNIAAGRAALDKELHRLGFHDVSFEKLAQSFHLSKVDELLAAIGRGDIKISQIVHLLHQKFSRDITPLETRSERSAPSPHPDGDIHIHGVGNLLTNLAQCCKPVPGDAIAGYITRGKGVTIHRKDCLHVDRNNSENPERMVEVDWGGESEKGYPVDIQVVALDRPGLLRDITAMLANEKVNILGVNTQTGKRDRIANMHITIEIADINKLSRILEKLGQLPNIMEVRRKVH